MGIYRAEGWFPDRRVRRNDDVTRLIFRSRTEDGSVGSGASAQSSVCFPAGLASSQSPSPGAGARTGLAPAAQGIAIEGLVKDYSPQASAFLLDQPLNGTKTGLIGTYIFRPPENSEDVAERRSLESMPYAPRVGGPAHRYLGGG